MKKNINISNCIPKFILLFFINLIILSLFFFKKNEKTIRKIGVVGVRHEVNIGNNLLKYAISIKLKELGYKPFIIGTHWNNFNISFINETTNLVIISNNFSEIKKDQFDILMVNSDQTWRKFDNNFYDYGFLKFAAKWNIRKFVYGASLGFDDWQLSLSDDQIAKNLLKNFTGISVREEGSIKLIEQHFGVSPQLVLDPTLLINKKYYLDIIKNYKGKISIKKKYIFIYNVLSSQYIRSAIKIAKNIFDYESYYFQINSTSSVKDFIYYLVKSNAVITNSYHGTIFAIIFNKPFITIFDKTNARERFTTIGNIFDVHDRLFEKNQNINIYKLMKPLNIDYKLLNQLKLKSINFIKKNLI